MTVTLIQLIQMPQHLFLCLENDASDDTALDACLDHDWATVELTPLAVLTAW